jgi:hypothetical protein
VRGAEKDAELDIVTLSCFISELQPFGSLSLPLLSQLNSRPEWVRGSATQCATLLFSIPALSPHTRSLSSNLTSFLSFSSVEKVGRGASDPARYLNEDSREISMEFLRSKINIKS